MSGEVIWEASEERKSSSQMRAFALYLQSRFTNFAFDDYEAMHQFSITHSEMFWQACADFVEITWQQQATKIKSGQGMLDTTWFEGAKLNYCENILAPNSDDSIAIYSYVEGKSVEGNVEHALQKITHRQLQRQVLRCAAALQKAGVGKGTVVSGILANVPEAIIAALATAMLGGIWASCSPDFGESGIYERLQQLKPRVIFFTPAYIYAGKHYDCRLKIFNLLKKFPHTLAIATPHLNCDACDDYLSFEKFLLADHTPIVYAEMNFSDPLFIMFSSGTTGVPKCIVHTVGGTLLQHKKELRIHGNLGAGDCLLFYTTCGWMMWNWMLSALSVRCAIGLYEGAPHYPDASNLWRVASMMNATAVGVNPRYINLCNSMCKEARCELPQLKTIFSTGAPLHSEHYRIVYDKIKADVHLASISGGTDILSCFMLGNVMLPVRVEEIQVKGLGMDIHAFNAQGESVIDEKGELVCVSPFVSMPKGFLNDATKTKYRAAYFRFYPDQEVWRHGDYVKITSNGGVKVYGRSDTVLNPHGVRIGSAEIYRQLEGIDDLEDSIVIDHNSQLLLFVVLKGNRKLLAQHENSIRNQIATSLTKRHVPKHIYQVKSLPYTLNGKKMELAVKQTFAGEEVRNQSAMANPESLDEIRRCRLRR